MGVLLVSLSALRDLGVDGVLTDCDLQNRIRRCIR
jgi:hypothetical protein